MIVAVKELAVTKIKVDLNPLLRKWYCPKTIGTQTHLRDGLRIGTLCK